MDIPVCAEDEHTPLPSRRLCQHSHQGFWATQRNITSPRPTFSLQAAHQKEVSDSRSKYPMKERRVRWRYQIHSPEAPTHLPEPAPLKQDTACPKKFHSDIGPYEELQEGNQSCHKDGQDQQLVYKDVQHFPAMSVIVHDKS